MKKFKTVMILIFLLTPFISETIDNDIIDIYMVNVRNAMNIYDRSRNLQAYEKSFVAFTDSFIIDIFTQVVKDKDCINVFENLNYEPRMGITVDKKFMRIILGIDFPLKNEGDIYSQRSLIEIYPLPERNNGNTYLIYEGQWMITNPDSIDPDLGPEICGVGAVRLIQYNEANKKYEIIVRGEETNLAKYKFKHALRDADGKILDNASLIGTPKYRNRGGDYFIVAKDGSISFTGKGCKAPAPGATHCIRYETDWVLTPSNKLIAKEIRWDIKDEEDENGKLKQVYTTIKFE